MSDGPLISTPALTLPGETGLSIYDGSLEEWAADPALPLVVGE